MPTEIEYKEKLSPPFQSYRNVEVYGNDKSKRLAELPKEVGAFENALSSVAKQIKDGKWAVSR